jgi:hypothetical protein
MHPDEPSTPHEATTLGSFDRRRLLGYAAASAVVAAPSVLRPSGPASALAQLGETTAAVDSIQEALAVAAQQAWGGWSNGKIPSTALTPVQASVAGSGFLRDDAARQYLSMSLAFSAVFGRPLLITEGYRDYARQVSYWNAYQAGTGNLAAYPGTSNHGWGISCDFGSQVQTAGTAAKRWMDANAPSYGWQPTGNGFSRPEPWHFDYVGAYAGPSAGALVDSGLVMVRCTENLEQVGLVYTALLSMRSLKHLLTMNQITALRAVGVPYYELSKAQFLALLDGLSIPRSAVSVSSDYWRR